MPVIKTIVDDDTYAELVTLRKAEGLPSVSALFLKRCGALSEDQEAHEIVRMALKRAANKDPGYTFSLKGLFGARWTTFREGSRRRAGKLFFQQVNARRHGLKIGGKSPSNHQLYIVV